MFFSSNNPAKAAFDLVVKTFKKNKWKYEANKDKLQVKTIFSGDDLDMTLYISIDEDRDLLRIYSFLPEDFPSDKIALGAFATAAVNWKIANGTFDYDVSDGTVMFRVVNSFRNCPMSKEIIDYLVHITVGTVDEYNDKLVDLAKGRMTLDQFMSAINN